MVCCPCHSDPHLGACNCNCNEEKKRAERMRIADNARTKSGNKGSRANVVMVISAFMIVVGMFAYAIYDGTKGNSIAAQKRASGGWALRSTHILEDPGREILEYMLPHRNDSLWMIIPRRAIGIIKRADGENYTTIKFSGGFERLQTVVVNGKTYNACAPYWVDILVPSLKDVETWVNWVDERKRIFEKRKLENREEYESKKIRVLPNK